MSGCASRDQWGWPYQVACRLRPGGGADGLVRDEQGRVLAFVMGETGRPRMSDSGGVLAQVPPDDVREAAERWWVDQQQTD